MKFIAHRGACLEETEDTLASPLRAASYGAYAVECDPRFTKDGKLVIFHDDTLKRLAGDPARVIDLDYADMKARLASKNLALTTFDEVLRDYTGASAVLFDLSFDATDPEFFKLLRDAPFRAIAGVHDPKEAEAARKYLPAEDVLAFMPKPSMAEDFHEAGCGILRLWEHWLTDVSPADVRRLVGETEVWIMAHDPTVLHPLFSMNGSPASIEKVKALGADGILLNDIRMAMAH
ncbi:MAG: hypothetical protein MJ141_00625 [Clostridia bacterium]|nr:hypothetical protein [Clostridia bacterium]